MLARSGVSVWRLTCVAARTTNPGETVSGSDIDRHLGRRIRDAREQVGRTRTELPKRLEIEESTLNAMEAGEVRIASLNLARIARDL